MTWFSFCLPSVSPDSYYFISHSTRQATKHLGAEQKKLLNLYEGVQKYKVGEWEEKKRGQEIFV